MPLPILKLSVPKGLNNESQAVQFQQLLSVVPGVVRVDVNLAKRLARVVSEQPLALELLQEKVGEQFSLAPFSEQPNAAGQVLDVALEGLHCRACELTIERAWKKLPGVGSVQVSAASQRARIVCSDCQPDVAVLQAAIADDGYEVKSVRVEGEAGGESRINEKLKMTLLRPASDGATAGNKNEKMFDGMQSEERRAKGSGHPSWWQLVGLFALVLLLGKLLSKLGLLKLSAAVGDATSLGAVFVIGLVAASSTCIAVSGGLLLSSAARFNERYQSATRWGKMRPVLLFTFGRIASYALLGGLIGLLGASLTPSPAVTGAITVLAALYMLVMGLDMLGFAPVWLKRFTPAMPKWLGHRVLDQQGRTHWAMPSLLGAGTFFLPCGFTQSLQIYALTTGSFWESAGVLGAFALGTAPALVALGWASSAVKGKTGQWFFRFAGAMVVVLGIWNIQNGFTIAGYPLSWPRFGSDSKAGIAHDPNVTYDGQQQVVRMSIGQSGYEPRLATLRAGVPTKLEIDTGNGAIGCAASFTIPRLGIRQYLRAGVNEVAFIAPAEPGSLPFSCSMGMFRGEFRIVPRA